METPMRHRRTLAGCALVAGVALALAGCGGSSSGVTPAAGGSAGAGSQQAPPKVAMAQALPAAEGQLNIIAWAGYAEDGSTDKTVDWVHPFTAATGCKLNVKIGNTSDEMVSLMKTGQYDGVSASGDATLRLIYGGDVAPVNTALVPNYATIADFLKNKPWNSVNGQMYGIPHGWGANLLMWNTKVVTTPPDSWGAVFDANSPYKGKLTAYDSPIYIADAALYLKSAKPGLGITNPYELDDKQFTAAVDLLKTQKGLIGQYWSGYQQNVDAYDNGDAVLGTTWQINANLIAGEKKVNVQTVIPKEGSTGWSDTWMVASKAKDPGCMYRWMDWITSAKVNAQVAEWFGEAPAQTTACAQTADKTHCATYHALDAAYAGKISYWTTPTKNCGDSRGSTCKDYAAWTQAWTEIKG
jgi:putative spermidine/putrescine transport system substrate-binding protein